MTLAEEHAENVESQLKVLQENLKKAEEAKFQEEGQKIKLDQALARIKVGYCITKRMVVWQ